MLSREPLAFLIGSSKLRLEVRRHPFDLGCDDLTGSEEPKVDRLAMLSDEDLELSVPGGVRLRDKMLRVPQLPGVAQAR